MNISYNHPLIAVIEAVYVIYIMNFFKTRYSLAHPLTYFENKLLYHPVGTASKPICNICPLGNIGAFFIAAFILLRTFLLIKMPKQKESIKMASIFVLLVVAVLSLLNFNAVVYLAPYYVLEILLIKNM